MDVSMMLYGQREMKTPTAFPIRTLIHDYPHNLIYVYAYMGYEPRHMKTIGFQRKKEELDQIKNRPLYGDFILQRLLFTRKQPLARPCFL